MDEFYLVAIGFVSVWCIFWGVLGMLWERVNNGKE